MRRLVPQTGLWRHSDFLKLWSAETISRFGSEISGLALPVVAIVVLEVSAFKVALLATIEFLPFILFTLPAGVWVDRLPRRPILVAGDLGRAVALASVPIAYAFDALTIWQLYVVGFVVGIGTVFFDVAYQSYLPSLVVREQLVEGNSKLEISRSASQIGGPSAAGGLIALLTAPLAVLLDAISFVVSALFLFRIRKQEELPVREGPRRGPFEGMGAELREGLRFVLGHPHLRAISACTALSNYFATFMFSIFLVYAVREVGLTAGVIGIVFGVSNFGFLAGALLANKISVRLGVGRTIISSAFLFGPALLLIPLAPDGAQIPFFIASFALVGFAVVIYNITQVSYRQGICPERLQGRMNSVIRFIVWGVIPLGSLSGGAIATGYGLRAAIWTGAIGAFFAFVPLVFSSLHRLERLPEPEEPLASEAAAAGGIANPA
ncbi:MAG: MFS transporter, partial [Actinobacteria bacterium]|nr:MFS transporter [Actinomycetota bacterium]